MHEETTCLISPLMVSNGLHSASSIHFSDKNGHRLPYSSHLYPKATHSRGEKIWGNGARCPPLHPYQSRVQTLVRSGRGADRVRLWDHGDPASVDARFARWVAATEDIKRANEEAGVPAADDEGMFRLLNVNGPSITFQRGAEDEFEHTLDSSHQDAIFKRISEANRQAEWIVCSLHAHESPDGKFADHATPSFMESFARDCIEVGADVVVSHGPHVVRGIEIHDGSPIFYGFGDFIVQELLLDRLSAEVYDRHGIDRDATPADVFDAIEGQYLLTRAFWETILPVCEYDDGELAGIEIYPLDLGYNRPRPQSGIPRPADNETAQRILRKLDDCCESYGVDVLIEDGHGRINVS